jgi:hypothetical protein
MPEQILLCGFYCAAFGSVLLLYSIMQDLIRQTFSNSDNREDLHRHNKSAGILISNGGFRGYDSPEVCAEDRMLRMDQCRKDIAGDGRKQLLH